MKTYSTVQPAPYYVRKVENDEAFIRLRQNIIESIGSLEEGETASTYEYDEVEVRISDRVRLEEYILANFSALFEMGKKEALAKAAPTLEERIDELELYILMQGGII